MDSVKQFPYTLTVTVKSGEKLKVADLFSSDPYAKISIGGKYFGQTEYKANTLNPVWNETFKCPLLHLQSTLLIQVMDHDDYNTDDAMGVAEIDFSSLPVNTAVDFKRELQNVGNIVAKGSVSVSLRLEKANNLIRMEYITNESSPVSRRSTMRTHSDISSLSFEFADYRLSMPLHKALMTAPSTQTKTRMDWSFLKDMLCDVAMLSSNSSELARDALRRYVIHHKDFKKSFAQATRIDLLRNKASKTFPIQDKYVLLIETDAEIHYLVAPNRFQQWAWVRAFERALDGTAAQVRVNGTLRVRVGDAFKDCKCFFSSLTSHVSNVHREIVCEDLSDSTIIRLDISTIRAVSLSYDYAFVKKFELVVEVVAGKLKTSSRAKLDESLPHREFNAGGLNNIPVSLPSATPTAAVEARSCSMTRRQEVDFYFVDGGEENGHEGSQAADGTEASPDSLIIDDYTHMNKKKKWYPGKMLFRGGKAAASAVLNTVGNTATTTVNVVSSVAVGAGAGVVHVAEGAVGVVKGVGKTGVSIVKGTVKGVVATAETTIDLATGKDSAGRVVNVVGRNIKDSASSVANKSLDIAQGRLKQEVKSRIIVRSPYARELQTYPMVGTHPFWNEKYTFTMDQDELTQCLEDESLGLAMYLIQGKEEGTLTSSTFIPIRSLLVSPAQRLGLMRNTLSLSTVLPTVFPNGRSGETQLLQKEINLGAPFVPSLVDVPTGPCCQCLNFTIMKATHLTFPSEAADEQRKESSNKLADLFSLSGNGDGTKSLQAVAKLVKWMGQDRGVRFKKHLTSVQKVDVDHPDPEWNETISITEKEGLEWAAYIRIEVFDVNKDKDNGGRLGAAFIPIDAIPTSAPITKEFKLTPHRSIENFIRWHQVMDADYGLGVVTVQCQRVLARTIESNGSVILRSQLREVGCLDSFWAARSILAGSLFMDDAEKLAEGCKIFPSLDGLFVDVDVDTRLAAVENPLKFFAIDVSTLKVTHEDTYNESESSHGFFNIFSSHQRRGSKADKTAEPVPSIDGNNIFAVGSRRNSLKSTIEQQFQQDQEQFGYIVEIFCFENQRKDIIGQEFSAKHLLLTERPWLSDETGMIPFPFGNLEACTPPEGYEWIEKSWGLDLEYTACDEDGWSYSSDFLNIMSNLKKNDSNAESKNFFVRRRKWGRFARRCVFPRSGMNESTMRSALSGETNLNSQLEPVFFPIIPVNRREVFLRDGDGSVLSLCLERGASDEKGFCSGPVIIPWNQVMSVHVVTPSVLSVVVEIRRYLGNAMGTTEGSADPTIENFAPAQCELFVYNCPADDLALMLNERMSVSEAREELHGLLASKHINGAEGIERDAVKALTVLQEKPKDDQNTLQEDLMTISEAIALSKGSILMSQLDEAVVLMELKMEKLVEAHQGNAFQIDEYNVLTLRVSRLKLYLAALLGAGLKGGEADLNTFEKDRLVGEALHTQALERGADPIVASIDQVNFLLDAMEGRVRNISLSGFYMKNDELDRIFGELMNAYYVEIIRILAVFFDSLSRMESISGHTRKLELITFLIDNDDRVQLAVDGALRPYSRRSTPRPFLSEYLDISKFIGWYSVLLHKEMKLWVDRCFASSSEYDITECEFKYHLPWEPIAGTGSYQSNLRIDLVGSLKTFLDLPRPVPTPLTSREMNTTIDILNKAIVSAYGACFLHVAARFREVLLSSEWASPPITVSVTDEQAVFDSISGQMFWLCSVANDALFFSEHVAEALESSAAEMKAVQDRVKAEVAQNGMDHVSSNAARQLELSASVEIVLHESKDAFDDVRNITVDFLSCIIFKSFIDLLVSSHTAEWTIFCRKQNGINSAAVAHVAGVTRIEASAAASRDEDSIIDAVLDSIAIDFESYKQYVDQAAYENLVRICADKFVLRYFCLLKALAAEKILFCDLGQIERMRDEINKITKCLCNAIKSDSVNDELKFIEIIAKFELLYDALTLLEEIGESDKFIAKIMKAKNYANRHPELAHAIASFIRVCVSLKDGSDELMADRESVTPGLCTQIESFSTLEPPPVKEKKKRITGEDYDEFQDLEAVAEAVASEARKKELRPYPLELVFGQSAISMFPDKNGNSKRKSSIRSRWGGSGLGSSSQLTAASIDEKLKVALLNCANFYKARPTSQSAPEVVFEPTNTRSDGSKVAATTVVKEEKKAESEKKSNFFLSMFTKHRSDKEIIVEADEQPAVEEVNKISSPAQPKVAKTPLPYIDILEITARNLFSTDTLFSSIPNSFIQVTLERTSFSTEVVNNNADPRWTDHWMKIPVPKGFTGNSELIFSLFYKKRLGRPEFIGSITIMLAKFDASASVEDVYELNFAHSSEHVVNCFVKSTAGGVPTPTIKVKATLCRE